MLPGPVSLSPSRKDDGSGDVVMAAGMLRGQRWARSDAPVADATSPCFGDRATAASPTAAPPIGHALEAGRRRPAGPRSRCPYGVSIGLNKAAVSDRGDPGASMVHRNGQLRLPNQTLPPSCGRATGSVRGWPSLPQSDTVRERRSPWEGNGARSDLGWTLSQGR